MRLLAYAAMTVLGVASTSVVTRHLGVSRFGEYTTVLSVTTLIATITDSGMTSVANREYALLDGEQRERTLRALLGLRIFLTVIGIALSIGFALTAHFDSALVLGMLVAGTATFPLIVIHTLAIPLTNDLRLGTLALVELIRQALWVAMLLGLSLVGVGVFPLLATGLVANLLIIPAMIYVTRGSGRGALRISLSGWRTLIRATFAFSVASATGTIYLYGTQLITSLSTSHYQAGLFSVAFRVFVVVCTVPVLVGAATVPVLARASRAGQSQLVYLLQRYLETSVIGGLGLALVMSACSRLIIEVVAGPSFHGAATVVAIQSFALIATFIASPCSYGLLSLNLYRWLLLANASALVVMIVTASLLATRFGATGAAISSICGESTVAALMLAGLLKARPDCRPDWSFMGKTLLAALCAVPIALGPWLPSVPKAIAVMAVYSALVLLTRALPGEVLQTLPLMRRGPSRS